MESDTLETQYILEKTYIPSTDVSGVQSLFTTLTPVADGNVSHQIPTKLLLIDSSVEDYDFIIRSANTDTTCIIFDYNMDTLDTLKIKINDQSASFF